MFTIHRFFAICFSYASGVRKLINAHHWAGYPKVEKKRMNTQGTDIHVTKKMPLWPIMENDDILHKECLFGRLRLQNKRKEKNTKVFRLLSLPLPVSQKNYYFFKHNFKIELRNIKIQFKIKIFLRNLIILPFSGSLVPIINECF